MIRHVIMWKFREGEEENMHRFLNGLKALDGVIPEIRRMEVGVNVLLFRARQKIKQRYTEIEDYGL